MATTETASAALGPRYAPDDPTLPKPWLGLIDGGTGTLYYWNPETNVTQYDKPGAPPVPAASTPGLAPIPSGAGQQQMLQGQPSQPQQGNHFAQQQQSPHVAQTTQQQPSQAAQPVQQQQNSQLAQPTQQPGLHQARPQMMQPHGQQMMQYQGQQFQQMHHQMPPQVIRPQQFGQVNPQDHSTHVVQPQAPQFTPQNMHCTGYQSNMVTPRPPNSQQIQPNMLPSGQSTPQQNPHNIHNQSVESQQDFKTAMPKVEETEFKSGSQVGFSPSQYQQRSALPGQNNPNVPAEVSSGQVSIAGVNSGQPSTTSIMTKEDLGRATWTFLHTLALSYPEVELLYVMINSVVSAILSTEDHSELMQNIANKTSSRFFFIFRPFLISPPRRATTDIQKWRK